MNRLIIVGLAVALSSGTVYAQATGKARAGRTRKAKGAKAPAPAPTPTPPPAAGDPAAAAAPADGAPPANPTDPNAPNAPGIDKNTNLQAGGDDRPWAAGVSAERQARALEKFTEGNARLDDGLTKKAAELYREALTSWNHPAIHYNLALALVNQDQPIEQQEHLIEAIKHGDSPLEKEKFKTAKDYLALVEKQIAEVEVSCDKLGAEISVDGKQVFVVTQGGVNMYKGKVRVGKHTFVAKKTGYNAQIDAPFIGPGEKFRIKLTLYTAEELTRYKRRWDSGWIPYAVIGSGVLFGGLGGLLNVSANSSYSEFDTAIANCNQTSNNGGCDATDPALNELRSSGDTKRTLGFIGYGVAGAAVLAGGVLLYLNRERSYQITADEYKLEKQRKTGQVSVTPIVEPGMAGAMVFGRF